MSADPDRGADPSRSTSGSSTTIGVVGQPCRAEVTPWGDVTPWGSTAGRSASGDATLRWFVAAEDRWHDPSGEIAVRQQRVDGTPVIETRVRVPDGDAVQHVWAVPDRGGITIVEVTNESPLAFAVAFAGTDVLTDRPPAEVPIQGIDLPADAFVLPVGHRTTVRVGVPHDPARWVGRTLAEVRADRTAVVRGWCSTADRSSRLDLPDERLAVEVTEARCDLLVGGPIAASDDPTGFVLDVVELVRLGERADAWLPELVDPIGVIARASAHSPDGATEAALVGAERVARAAHDARAAGDISRLRRRADGTGARVIPPFSEIVRSRSCGRFVAEVERRLAAAGDLLPAGIPTPWLGVDFEVHGIPLGVATSVSFAVRWHGERPALLWERDGDPLTLTATSVDPRWSSDEPTGEALWAAPARPRIVPVGGADPPSG